MSLPYGCAGTSFADSQREAVAELAMNFVAVNVANAEEFSVEQHHVDFSPPIDSKKLRIDLLSVSAHGC